MLTVLAITALCILGSRTAQAADPPPNILFIFADDQCYETVHAFGNEEIETRSESPPGRQPELGILLLGLERTAGELVENVGAHPDDVELNCSGTLAAAAARAACTN